MSSTQQTHPGWFRTPIAAAMLCGVVASAFHILDGHWIQPILQFMSFETQYYLMVYVTFVIYLAGPAICRRSARLFLKAVVLAVPVVILHCGIYSLLDRFVVPNLRSLWSYATLDKVLMILISMASTWAIAYFTSRMYGLRPCPRRVHVIAIVAGATASLLWYALYHLLLSSDDGSQPEIVPMAVMRSFLHDFIVTTLPAIAIERSLQIQAANARAEVARTSAATEAAQ